MGCFIADGYSPDEVKELVLSNIHVGYLFDIKGFWSGPGIISLAKIGEFIRKNLRHQRIEELPMPFYPTATNNIDGRQHIFTYGDIVDAVLAASSIPAIFQPVVIDGVPFIDGGVYNNLPAEPFGDRIGEAIAINVNPIAPYDPASSISRTIERAVILSFSHHIQTIAHRCHLYVEPQELQYFGIFDVRKLSEIYEAGYQYTKQLLAN